MFFQISPVIHKKNKQNLQKKSDDEESKVEILSLAPFTPNPKIVFEDVVIGTTQTRKLLIKNPTGQDVHLFVRKPVPEEMNLVLSWNEAQIEKGSETFLEMIWGPTTKEACRQSFTLSDGKKINRDVAVTFKSLAPKRLKAAGTKSKPKPIKSPIRLSLSRKTVSPTKKLKAQRKSPIKYTAIQRKSPKKYYSPPTKYLELYQVTDEYNTTKVEHTNVCQSSVWNEEKCKFQEKLSKRENKENMSPSFQHLLCNASASFTSPSYATFLMEDKNEERRDTYLLNPLRERRETYTLQIDNIQNFVDKENYFIKAADTFTIKSVDNSPNFSDSLESPGKISALREQNNQSSTTPTVASVLNNRDTFRKRKGSPNFEYKLKNLDNFTFSPTVSSYTNASPKLFLPTVCSTISKSFPKNNSFGTPTTLVTELFMEANNKSFQLNESNETYTKGNISSNTYIKGNSSFESCSQGNISTGTYVKDSSLGDIEHLDASPNFNRIHQNLSPVPFKQMSFELSSITESNKNTLETRRTRNLSSIAEESSIFSESVIRSGCKRKKMDLSGYPSKREKISTEINKNWSKKGGAAIQIAKSRTGLNLQQFTKPLPKNNTSQSLSTLRETNIKSVIVQNPFLYANIIDPFMTSQIYCSDEWIEQQEIHFKKWLNALLTPPKEFNTKTEVDVAQVWQECKKKEVAEAPTKEAMSLKFHSKSKLDYLRKQAQDLFRSKDISDVLQKVCLVVETGKLSIREDKDVHLNLKLKSDIMGLILSYNPLWLRIGLETIYNEIIPLKSNSDINGLANFILERFVKDPHLIKKHKTLYAPKYSLDLKKFILKKFLILVYFLDRAKNVKLIQHDPCLFCKNATEKESKLVLIHFARETLSAVGDVTKYLKCLGYVVTHVQSYIHEFDYAVKNLGVDLRDGVRLSRVMEIIQMRNDLSSKLRVPAISRLQKVHNMQLVFQSLQESGYPIQYDICAKDIVDGHREKTLSFLWQIIYKFEAPLMVKSATTIQTWLRSFPVMLKRMRLRKMYEQRENAATKIQLWYKRLKLSKMYLTLAKLLQKFIKERKQEIAAIKIQNFFKMKICRKIYLLQLNTIVKLQTYAKGWLVRHNYKRRIIAAKIIQKTFRGYVRKKEFLKLRNAAIFIQRKFIAKQEMRREKLTYHKLKVATLNIQRRYRANVEMKRCRKNFLVFKNAVIKIQSLYRMYILRKHFLKLLESTILIQTRYRAQMAMKQERSNYLTLKKVAVKIQQRFRANLQMNKYREEFLKQKNAAVKLQNLYRMYTLRKRFLNLQKAARLLQFRYKAQKAMKEQRSHYLALTCAALLIQRRFRANIEKNKCRKQFLEQKISAIKIQSFYKMYTIRKHFLQLQSVVKVIQIRYRAKVTMKEQRLKYLSFLKAIIFIQQRFRSILKMKKSREAFLVLKMATVKIQSFYRMHHSRRRFLKIQKATKILQERFRAQKAMLKKFGEYQALKKCVLCIQQRFRANKLRKEALLRYMGIRQSTITIQSYYRMFVARKYYLQLRDATLRIQRIYLAQRAMQEQKTSYQNLRNAAIVSQQKWRARKLYLQQRQEYLKLKTFTVTIQQKYRAKKHMRIDKQRYEEIRSATIKIQMWYKSILCMRVRRDEYLNMKKSVIVIEERYLALKSMRTESIRYQKLRKVTIRLQQCYKAKTQMKIDRNIYLNLKSAALTVQTRYRSLKLMQKLQSNFKKLKEMALFIQIKFRANRAMKIQRLTFVAQRNAAIRIQQWYRATITMKKCRNYYKLLKLAVKKIEAKYEAKKLMEHERRYYGNLRNASLVIQRRYKAVLMMREMRKKFMELRNAIILIQRRYRAKRAAQTDKIKYEELKNAAICIQRRYRANKSLQQTRTQWIALRKSTICIQRQYRAQKLMMRMRNNYQRLKNATIAIQRWYKAQKLMNKHTQEYQELRRVVTFVQQKFRANILAKRERAQYLKLKNAVVVIQQQFRAYLLMKVQKQKYMQLKEVTIRVQRKFRSVILMRQARGEFMALKRATIVIQRRYRANRAMLVQSLYYKRLKVAAVLVQQKFRANKLAAVQRLEYLKLKNAAIVIQRRYKANKSMICHVEEYSRIKWAVLVIQCRYKAQKAMRQEMLKYQKMRHATFVIQRRLKATLLSKRLRQWYLKFIHSVRIIQTRYRAYLLMKKKRELFLKKYKAVTQIQRFARGYLVRKKYSSLLTPEAVEARRLLKIQNAAAVKIQATWRAHYVRNSNNSLIVAIKKMREEKLNEPRISLSGRTLAQRCEMAMLCMTSENSSLLMVIKALEDLDFITRHCRDSCIRLSLILPNQLYIIISSAARSLPEMSACNMAAFILINFCKYPQTRENSWDPEYIDAMVNVMLHWCDKEAPLFSTLCTLLWLFGHVAAWKKVILDLPNIRQRFHKIYTLVQRKQNMIAKSKKINSASVFGQIGHMKLPTVNANWGLDYDRPNTFTNAIFALSSLMNILDIP